ncbi:response regulator [Petroclostridium sp. X23]|uniref:response regulator n=1 Tax=Petroclostridium sp. X23 TaxID=3045146 RepID=UPI0024ACED6E|nr:response regulator [Petroclostridium sp. X23]WHH60888.1 response regulator [Petroclostridium sp. X23]
MYKLLIADDEMRERNIIKVLLDRYCNESFQIYEAANGNDAVKLFNEVQPDLVFMDIKMPGLNGMEAINSIRTLNKCVYIIILTAYDYFEYAKEAIKSGVNDYLLKPLTRDKMKTALEAFFSEHSRKIKPIDIQDHENIHHYKSIISKTLASDLAYSLFNQTKIIKYLKLLDIDFLFGFCVILKIDIPTSSRNIRTDFIENYLEKLSTYVHTRMTEYNIGYVRTAMSNKLVLFILADKHKNMCKIRLQNNLAMALDNIETRFNFFAVNRAIGACYTEISNIHKSFEQAMHQLNNAGHVEMPMDIEQYKKMITKLVRESNILHIEEIISELISKINVFQLEIAVQKTLYVELFTYVTRETISKSMQREYIDKLSNIINLSTVDEIRNFCIGFSGQLIVDVEKQSKERTNYIIEKAKEFLYENYNKEITVQDLAEKYSLNPHYFSKLFKIYESTAFSDFLTDIRIKKAINMMRETTKSLKEISNEVGYQDPNYFSRVFKKTVGISPKKYKNNFLK